MRPDNALILDMLVASQKTVRYTNDMNFDEFVKNDLVQSAVIREILVIGEAARNVTDILKEAYADIAWKDIIGMRNKLVHEYFHIRADVVWDTIHNSIKPLIP